MQKFSQYSKIPGLKINESVVKLGNEFKVNSTYIVPLELIKQFTDKVKEETKKNPFEFWSAAEIAEQMIKYTLDQFMKIENLPSEILVGDEDSDSKKSDEVNVEDVNSSSEEKEKKPEVEVAQEPAEAKKEEEEEESNYMNVYTTMGNPVSTGFKLNTLTQKSSADTKVGLHEGLTDNDIS